MNPEFGRYQLVKVTGASGTSSAFIVTHLKAFALSGPFIVGTREKGYFIFDTSKPDNAPLTFDAVAQWNEALLSLNVSANIKLNDPDAVASRTGELQLHPWNYRVMKGSFGWSDGAWAAIIEWLGLGAASAYGTIGRSKSLISAVAVFLGLAAAMVGEILINGGGGAAFVGLFLFPFIYLIAARASHWFRRLLSKREPVSD